MNINSNALITGASNGIGRAISIELAKHGVNTIVVGRDPSKLNSLINEIKDLNIAYPIVADLMEPGKVDEVYKEAVNLLGNIDILINCAGAIKMNSIIETTEKHWDLQMYLNLKVPFLLSQKVLKDMRLNKKGWIINISSEAALDKNKNTGAYTISKNALNTLTELVNIENRSYNIRSMALCPGWVNTNAVLDPSLVGLSTEDILQPHDVAKYVLFMLSQPPNIMVDSIQKIVPIKEQASLTKGSAKYFELKESGLI